MKKYVSALTAMVVILASVCAPGVSYAQEEVLGQYEELSSSEGIVESPNEEYFDPDEASLAPDEGSLAAGRNARTVTLKQGDLISNLETTCTAGYIDHDQHALLIAAHCGSPGDVFYIKNSFGRYTRIGVMNDNDYDPSIYRNDFAYISLDDHIVGENVYSGDGRVMLSDIHIGDRLCSYGQKSDAVKCGVVTDINGSVILSNRESGGVKGDSGGPGWIPGKGFVGVYSLFWGENKYPTENTRRNGVGFTYPQYSDRKDPVHLPYRPISIEAPMMTPPQQTSLIVKGETQQEKTTQNTTDSQLSPESIIAIIFGVFSILASIGFLFNNIMRK